MWEADENSLLISISIVIETRQYKNNRKNPVRRLDVFCSNLSKKVSFFDYRQIWNVVLQKIGLMIS